MSTTLPLKKGNTLLLNNKVSTSSGPVNLTGWEIKSQVKDGQTLVATLSVEIVNASLGEYKLKFNGNTSTWPDKRLRCDIRYVSPDGQVISSDTFFIQMEQGVTS